MVRITFRSNEEESRRCESEGPNVEHERAERSRSGEKHIEKNTWVRMWRHGHNTGVSDHEMRRKNVLCVLPRVGARGFHYTFHVKPHYAQFLRLSVQVAPQLLLADYGTLVENIKRA